MYVCMYVCTFVRTYVCMYVCMYVYVCVFNYLCIMCVIVMTHIKDTAWDVNLLEMPTPTSVL